MIRLLLSFYRTSLELKLFKRFNIGWEERAFYRTSLELKLCSNTGWSISSFSFYRTSLELKLVSQHLFCDLYSFLSNQFGIEIIQHSERAYILRLFIEPVWNWNMLAPAFADSKLYSFYRTSLELKLMRRYLFQITQSLFIEPVWNWN